MWSSFDIPTHFSADISDLIRRLLTLTPTSRLGTEASSSAAIKSHIFFQGVDWNEVNSCQVCLPHLTLPR